MKKEGIQCEKLGESCDIIQESYKYIIYEEFQRSLFSIKTYKRFDYYMLSNKQFPWKFFLKKPQDSDINEYGTTFNSYAQIFKMLEQRKI